MLSFLSFEDRQIAYGITEFLALLLLGLALSRVGVKWVLVSLMSSLSVALLLTRLLKAGKFTTSLCRFVIKSSVYLCIAG